MRPGGDPILDRAGFEPTRFPADPMSGLFRRLSSRGSAGPDGLEPPAQAEPGTADAPTTAPTDPGGHESLLADPAAQPRALPQPEPAPVVVHPLVEAPPEPPPLPVSDLPAGLDPDGLAAAPPPSARRSRLRRRISFLR